MNFGLERVESEFVGCLDSDSSVHPEALKRIISFFDNPLTMAVAPSIVVRNPKGIIQYAQRAEYDVAHYNKKMLAFLEGIHVTPGPFSIFRKKVFDEIGCYRKAHNTEDQEIALRMHKNGYRIDHCPDAYVYTSGPDTVKKLYKQRVRWIYGFIRNAIDYKNFLFNSKYGTIGIFTLPSGFISILEILILLMFMISRLYNFIFSKIMQAQAVGAGSFFNGGFSFNPFFIDTRAFLFITIILYVLIVISLFNGRRMISGRKILSWDILLFIVVYSVVAPFWILKAMWNALRSHETSWQAERYYKLAK
jgi:cellulose synthase/poly-beta-1,6-N-acetylglucosamine synthase-like glycosyltransferase